MCAGAQLYSLAETPQCPSSPRIRAHIRGRYGSDKIDDIFLSPLAHSIILVILTTSWIRIALWITLYGWKYGGEQEKSRIFLYLYYFLTPLLKSQCYKLMRMSGPVLHLTSVCRDLSYKAEEVFGTWNTGTKCVGDVTDLLWWDVEWDGAEVHLLVGVDAGQDKEDSRTLSASPFTSFLDSAALNA